MYSYIGTICDSLVVGTTAEGKIEPDFHTSLKEHRRTVYNVLRVTDK